MRRSDIFFLLILLPLDYSAVFLSLIVSYGLRNFLTEAYIQPFSVFIQLAILISSFWVLGFIVAGLYSLELKRVSWEEFFGIILGTGVGITLTSAAIFIFKEFDFSRMVLLIAGFTSVIFVLIERFLAKTFENLIYKAGFALDRVLIVGQGEEANFVVKAFEKEGDANYKILGKFQFDETFNRTFEELKPNEVIVADPKLSREDLDTIFDICEERGARFKFVPDVFHGSPAVIAATSVDGLPLIELKATTLDGWPVVLKRLLDTLIALIGLIITSPLLLIVALVIKLDSPGSILFPHGRVGRNGKNFYLYKFRSMQMTEKNGKLVHALEDKEVERLKELQPNYKLEYDPRVTRVGYLIRRASIDELPQLWNVLKGEMSIVGPRAYIEKELAVQRERFPETGEQIRRLLTVKPGITGLWQVSGRSNIDFSGRVAMDAHYATHANLLMDLKIIMRTIPAVLKGSGAM